ncbi:hypothetical protein [Comamonas sp. JC664]|uniref:hypothetical protein n=1 Tax=Comamonas sp. JC664 TaxID=2801917 RepID=UPI001748768B|nr:hypothetical protein [Comamonas sp. JC664]MBL0697120.1 hypothetical protein [Comamonas sp. JC664]GHG82632.1 hypothetical protein GCM10012319_36880 [Comamonas sp. KCTC 72670]
MAGEARQTGTRDEQYNLISALYHLLKGASTSEASIRDAEESGDPELAQFFRDWQEEQRNLAERAKNLLGARMAGVSRAGTGRKRAAQGGKSRGAASSTEKQPTTASVDSGGDDTARDAVDEELMETFPASDPPARY